MVAAAAKPELPRLTFRRKSRLSHARDYQAAFRDGVRKGRGPFILFVRPNGLDHSRLGLSVPRRVGSAVERNRIKRRLREAYRLHQHEAPSGYDLVVAVRPHAALALDEYGRLLLDAWRAGDKVWVKRQSGSGSDA